MSDNQKVCTKVTKTLKKKLSGFNQHHVAVLALMVAGIVLSRKARLNCIAAESPSEAKDLSVFRQLQRFVSNENIDVQMHYLPFAEQIIEALSVNAMTFALDGSTVGRGCMTLMVGIVYRNRMLPLMWIVYKGKKGHTTAKRHIELLQLLHPLLKEHSNITLVGDGEFDNVAMLEWIQKNTNWSYVVRTAKSCKIVLWGEKNSIGKMAEKGWLIFQKDTLFTGKEFGPVTAMAWWEEEYKEAIFLLTNINDIDRACEEYSKRSLIETLFSDQKSRGFGIDKSHLSNPDKISRLLLGSCMAYLWMIWLGVEVIKTGNLGWIDHANRQDKSIFRLGLDWLKHLLKRGKNLTICFDIPVLSDESLGVM